MQNKNLHGVIARVARSARASLVAISTEIVVVTHETFVAFASVAGNEIRADEILEPISMITT